MRAYDEDQNLDVEEASDELKIAVSFVGRQSQTGLTRFSAPMSTSLVKDFIPDPTKVTEAKEILQKLGFEITGTGKLTLSIRGSRELYEKVFRTTLSKFTATQGSFREKKEFYFPGDGAPFALPPELINLIDDAYIQWPHTYMQDRFDSAIESPLPPSVDAYYLTLDNVVTLLNVDKVHRAGYTGKNIRVAMIDSGFAHGHPYFIEKGYNSSVALAGRAANRDRDGIGHGTGESANVLAVAPNASFIGIKLDNETTGSSSSILEGFMEALKHRPQIITVSLGYDMCDRSTNTVFDQLPNSLAALEGEIQDAIADGIIVIFSAGNGHIAFPGMLPEVISAGGVYIEKSGSMRASNYASAFKSKIYPGRNVPDVCGLVGLLPNADYIMLPVQSNCRLDRKCSTFDGTTDSDGWARFSGTSAAAPQLAGICALLLEKSPGLRPAEIKALLQRTARDVTTGSAHPGSNPLGPALSAGAGNDGATGAGLVDALAALNQL